PWWRNTTSNNSQPGISAWMNQLNQAQLNQLNQNPALLNLLNQNPALLNQLLQNPALLNQLLQNPALLNQLNGLNNGQALNSAGFPFFGGAFFPFSPYYNNAYVTGQPGYALPDTFIAGP